MVKPGKNRTVWILCAVLAALLLASAGLLLSSSVPLTRDAFTGVFSALLMAASFAVLTFTRIDSAWLMLGAAVAGLATLFVH